MILDDQKDEEMRRDKNEYDGNREFDNKLKSVRKDRRAIPRERIAC
jgi:hypothetical protein